MPFSLEPFQLKVKKPWGHEIIWTPPGLERSGKLLSVLAGKRLSLQYHDAKEETICLLSGRALIWLEDDAGVIRKVPMEPERGYTVTPMQKHRIEAIVDSVLLEVSSPESGNTVRIDDDYYRGTETESDRAAARANHQT